MGYLPMRISTIQPNRKVTFDIYIYFKNNYLKYTHRGSELTNEKLAKLLAQEIAKFYITEEDAENYNLFITQVLKESVKDPNLSVEEKLNISAGAAQTALENFQMNLTEDNFKMSKKAASSLRQVIQENPKALKGLFGKGSVEADRIINHSLSVCALSTKLGEKLKLKEEDLEDLATASLIHDIGIVRLDQNTQLLFTKNKENFTPQDFRDYNVHCKDAINLLKEKPWFSKKIESIVMNHHETLQGTGPHKLTKLEPVVEVISICNSYDKKLLQSGKEPMETFKEFNIDEMGNYNLKTIEKFKDVLKEEGLID